MPRAENFRQPVKQDFHVLRPQVTAGTKKQAGSHLPEANNRQARRAKKKEEK